MWLPCYKYEVASYHLEKAQIFSRLLSIYIRPHKISARSAFPTFFLPLCTVLPLPLLLGEIGMTWWIVCHAFHLNSLLFSEYAMIFCASVCSTLFLLLGVLESFLFMCRDVSDPMHPRPWLYSYLLYHQNNLTILFSMPVFPLNQDLALFLCFFRLYNVVPGTLTY